MLVSFPYSIVNGEYISCVKTLIVDPTQVAIQGVITSDVLDGIADTEMTALYIEHNGNVYGSVGMTPLEFAQLSNQCCAGEDGNDCIQDSDGFCILDNHGEPLLGVAA